MTALETLLIDTGEQIDWPTSPDLSARVAHRIGAGSDPRRQSRRRWIPVVATFVALVIGLLVLSPATRQAIADLLGVAGIRIELGSQGMENIGFELDLGEMVNLATADDEAGFAVSTPATDQLPDPEGIFFSDSPTGGAVTLTWAPSASLPEVGDTGVGLLISQFRGDREEGDYLKEASAGTEIEVVVVSGNDGFWLHGAPHLLSYRDATGVIRREVSRLAANVLIWEENGVTFRIESNLGLDASLAIAEGMTPNR